MIALQRCKVWWFVLTLIAVGCSDADDGDHYRDAGPAADAGEDAASEPAKLDGSLTASGTHACAIRRTGLYCWGANFRGQLGDQTTLDSVGPVAATGAGDDVVEVAANTGRTCVRRSTGEVACWGANESGQIGDGTRADSLQAVPAVGIDDALQIAVDTTSTCALRGKRGTIECWGESPDLTPDAGSLVPQAVPGISGAVELRVGAISGYCARGREGWVRCFRFDVDAGTWSQPTQADSLQGARAIALPAREEVCGITEARDIACQSVDDGFTVTLPSSENAVAIHALGSLALVARNSEGKSLLWNVPSIIWSEMGMQNVVGAYAIELDSNVPLIHLAIGGFQFCALRQDRSVVCVDGGAGGLEGQRFVLTSVVDGLPD